MVSPIKITKKIIETNLASTFPTIPIAYENAKFDPTNKPLYFAVQFTIQQPDDPVFAGRYYRERIQAQIFVCAELNKGASVAFDKAEEIRGLFFKGFTQSDSNCIVHILRTPQVAGGIKTFDRYAVPVYVDIVTEIDPS